MINNFITYYEFIEGFEKKIQKQILNYSVLSWRRFGFEVEVLSRKDAEDHSLYKDLLFAASKHCKPKKINVWSERMRQHSENSIIRWLAFAQSRCSNFFMGDYDVLNMGVHPEDLEYSNLTFLDHACLCFAYADDSDWCEYFAEIIIKNIDIMEEWDEPNNYYHDQNFVCQLLDVAPNLLRDAGITLERKYVAQPKNGIIPNNCKFLHVSHESCKCNELQRVDLTKRAVDKIIENSQ